MSFAALGNLIDTTIKGYGKSISDTLITQLTPFLIVCVTLYIVIKGYGFMTGRAENSVPDTVAKLMKIGFITYLFLNTGNYMANAVDLIKESQSALLNALPGYDSSASDWGVVDTMWDGCTDGLVQLLACWDKLSVTAVGSNFLMVFFILLYLGAMAYITFAVLGIFIVAHIMAQILFGFGPFFISLLLFPLTRSWFDGWAKSVMTNVFTIVILSAVAIMVSTILKTQITDFTEGAKILRENFSENGFKKLATSLFLLLIIVFAMSTLIKQVPSLASGLIGGVAMGAVGLGQMMSNIGGGVAKGAAAVATGGAGAAALAGKAAMANRLSSFAKIMGGQSGVGGRVSSFIERNTRSNSESVHTQQPSVRTQRTVNAANSKK